MTTPRAHTPRRPRAAAARRPESARVPSRERMIDATSVLLQKQGYAGTGLSEILEASAAPRGSLYFHFPGGKEQLACEALVASGEVWKRRIDELTAGITDPGEAAAAVCTMLGDRLEASDWELGCPIATVALEAAAGSEAIRRTCADHFAGWEAIIARRLTAGGFAPEIAATAATLAVSAVEGALLLARVYRSREPLDRVALGLRAQLASFALLAR